MNASFGELKATAQINLGYLETTENWFRTTKEVAQLFLLENMSKIVGGNIRYLQIKHIGLDIYEIRLLPLGKKSTVLVEMWKTETNGL